MTIEDGVADSFYTNQFEEGSVPFIDSAKVSANKVVVAWADYSNNGKLTTAILTVDQAVNLHSSPLYVIGQALATDQLANYTVSVAGLSIDAYGQVGAVVIDRKPATDAANSGNVALVEVAPKAFGVAVQNAFAGQSTKIVVNGLADLPRAFPTDLQPGHLYYGLTDGSIEAGPLAGTVDKSAPYVTLSDGTIVTVDSAVGVAVSKRQLYVLPSFN
jgi:predicted RecA/RadA family phage recombinase